MNQIVPNDIGEVSLTHWSPGRSLSYEDWAGIGYTLQAMYKSLPWWVGDWLNYGERQYGDVYTQALEITGSSLSTLQNYKWVAGRVDRSVRTELLSWTAHLYVAKFEPDEQRYWLQQTLQNGWQSRDLKLALKEADPVETVIDRTADDEPPPGGEPEPYSEPNREGTLHEQLHMANRVIAQGIRLMPIAEASRWQLAREYLNLYDVDILD